MNKTRILIVEDEFIVAKDIETRLTRAGYEVSGVADQGLEAIRRLEESPADIVLMDIALRGNMDGVEAAAQILDRFDIPVIYLTAHANPDTLQRARVTGPFGYLLKPFEERELLAAIEMALYKYKLEKQWRERERWLSTILNSIGDAVVVTDVQGRITFLNPVAERLIGQTQDEVIGRPITDSLLITQHHDALPPLSPRGRGKERGELRGD